MDTFDTSNTQNISYQSDTLYLSAQVIYSSLQFALPLMKLDAITGEQLGYYLSILPEHLCYAVHGHTLFNDEIYVYPNYEVEVVLDIWHIGSLRVIDGKAMLLNLEIYL